MTDARDEKDRLVPDILSILPLRNTVVFPRAVVPLGAGRASSLRLIEAARGRALPEDRVPLADAPRRARERRGRGRRAERARGPDRVIAADAVDGAQAGAARDDRRQTTARAARRRARQGGRGPGARLEDPVRRPVGDVEDATRVLPARADEGDPEGAR